MSPGPKYVHASDEEGAAVREDEEAEPEEDGAGSAAEAVLSTGSKIRVKRIEGWGASPSNLTCDEGQFPISKSKSDGNRVPKIIPYVPSLLIAPFEPPTLQATWGGYKGEEKVSGGEIASLQL